MKLFKLIIFLFVIYFIRRFWQLYKAIERRGSEIRNQEAKVNSGKKVNDPNTVEAEFKVVDR